MKKKTLIGIALILLVSMLAGCGGISKTEFDAAVADRDAAKTQVTSLQNQIATLQSNLTAANTAKTKAEADLAAAQDSLTKANNDLTASKAQVTTLNTQVTDLNKQITDLKAQLAALQPKLSFKAATYTNTTYKFSFQYDASWTATWNSAVNPVSYGNATYYDPSVRVYVYPKSLGATLADVLKTNDFMTNINTAAPPKNPVIGTTVADKTNSYGTKVTAITHQYTNTDASIAYCQSYGFLKGDNWIILFLTQNSAWGITNLTGIYPDEVFGTWQFTQ